MMNRGIVAVGQHPEFSRRDTRLKVQTPDVAAGAPNLIHSLRLLCPLGGDGSEFPRLDEHPGAVLRATPVRRPGVTQGDRGVGGGATLNSLGPTLQIRGDGLGGCSVRRDGDSPEPGLLVEPVDQGAVHMRQGAQVEEGSLQRQGERGVRCCVRSCVGHCGPGRARRIRSMEIDHPCRWQLR